MYSDEGSDPVMMDTLGIKKQQIEGIRDPTQEFVIPTQVDPEHIKKMAERYLLDHGIEIPQPTSE
jgi:hypothetical protein